MAHRFELVEELAGASCWRHRDNRLTVLTWPTPVAPVVGFGIVYRVGSRHEVAGHTGATHLLEHLMFKGTRRFNRGSGTDIARQLHRVGANFNATTWLDRTSYFEVLPTDQLQLAVDIEADRMRGTLVRDQDLASERTVVLNELDMGENDPFEVLLKESFAHAYIEHPYHHPTIGWRSDVEHVTGGVLRSFYDTYYHPDNATVLVVGDVDERVALDEVERGFGGIEPAPGPFPEVTTREREQRGERRFSIHRAGELGCLALTWHIPEGLHPDLPALQVLTQVLTDGVTSRLHQRLVETNRCLGVHASALELHDPGVFQILASLAPGVDHREVEESIRDEVERIGSEPPSGDELARAKVQTRTDIAFQHESPGRLMAALTETVAVGDWRKFLRELELVSAVSSEDLQRVAASYLTERRLTAGWFVPDGPGSGGPVVPTRPGPRPCCYQGTFSERVSVHDLPGGARLAVLPNLHAPTVTVAGSLPGGVAYAVDGRLSVPGLTAAMLERGTASRDRLALARELEDHGLQLGFQASANLPTAVTFSGQGLAEQLPLLVRLLVEMLRAPTFPVGELDKLRERVLGALVRERDETHALAYAALTRHLYPRGHPLHRRPIADREQEVLGLTRDDLEGFHDAAYGPDGLVLAVVGQVEPAEVVAEIAGLLEGWAPTSRQLPSLPEAAVEPSARELIDVPDRPNLDVFLGHRGRLRRGDHDYAAAVLANSCLGQSTLTSRLGVAVRDREGLTYGIYSRFFGTLVVPGPWVTFLTVAPANLERAVAVCRAELASYVADGPSEAELADERMAQSGAYRVGLATNSGVARELVAVLTAGQPLEHLDRYPEQLLAAGQEEVVEAIARHVRPDELVLTAAGTLAEQTAEE
jgi:zinc protease